MLYIIPIKNRLYFMKVQHILNLHCDTELKGCSIRIENKGIRCTVYCSNDLYKIISRIKNNHKKILEILSKCKEESSLLNEFCFGSITGTNIYVAPTISTTTSAVTYGQITVPVEFILPENIDDCLVTAIPIEKDNKL